MKPRGIFRVGKVQFSGTKKEHQKVLLKLDMPEQLCLFLVYDVFAMPDGYSEFFGERFKAYAIHQAPL